MIFEHNRFQIWNQLQHPLKHTLADFGYSNPAIPGVSSVEGTLNYIIAVLYPNAKAAVATTNDLPLVGNTINDFRVVQDDGDGKAAAYRWAQYEGEVSPTWHKVMDMDWSTDSILAAYLEISQDRFVMQKGKSDLDSAGAVITGIYAGQTVFGGNVANQNLTLKANSGDGVGAPTGFVQVDDHFRPAQNNLWDVGTSGSKFKSAYLSTSALIGNLTLSSGSIVDSGGTVSFGSNNLITTGDLQANNITATTQVKVDLGAQEVVLTPGSLITTEAAFSLGSTNVSTTGTLASSTHTITESAQTLILDATNGTKATILSSLSKIGFGSSDLDTTGALSAGAGTLSSLVVDDLTIDAHSIVSAHADLDLDAVTNIRLLKAATTLGITSTGTVSVTGQFNADNLRMDGNLLTATNSNGNLLLSADGTGVVKTVSDFVPNLDTIQNLGNNLLRFGDLNISGSITDGIVNIAIATLFSLRNSGYRDLANTVPAVTGDTMFWDATAGRWLASHPDAEITHNEVTGLTSGDAGHTQFAMLAGRASGQTIQGGTGNGEHLVLESTSGATKGTVKTKDNLVPFTNAVYNISVWDGTDLGSASLNFRHLYMKGEAKGLRLENFTSGTLPAASMQNLGRAVWATDVNRLYVDNGVSFSVVAGINKFQSDTSWNGTDLTKDVTVSGSITDARTAIWQFKDNANDFESISAKVQAISASVIRITTNVALPAGSYRLIGIE